MASIYIYMCHSKCISVEPHIVGHCGTDRRTCCMTIRHITFHTVTRGHERCMQGGVVQH